MEELNKFTTAFQKYNKKGENWLMSTIMAVKENGGVTGGGMKGFAQASIQSYRSMINKELLKEAAAPTLGAAGAGSVIPGVGTLTAGTTALFTSLNYGLETINTFNTAPEPFIPIALVTPSTVAIVLPLALACFFILVLASSSAITILIDSGVKPSLYLSGLLAISSSNKVLKVFIVSKP